jgi:hypothetical protein
VAIMSGLSGNEIYCLDLKGMSAGELVIGNSVHSLGFLGSIGAGLQNVFGGEANNPQQSWGFEGEPPEAVIKDSGTRAGTS